LRLEKVIPVTVIRGSEEIIYFISGEGEQMVDDQAPVKVGPGACVYIPADVYHSTLNTGSETMQLIIAYSPAGPERLLRDIPGCKVTERKISAEVAG
jgi:oxalate decarboxylase/phosphoglucose isomerase-like protein (cupin superfamily)